jgi:hypothetical protein
MSQYGSNAASAGANAGGRINDVDVPVGKCGLVGRLAGDGGHAAGGADGADDENTRAVVVRWSQDGLFRASIRHGRRCPSTQPVLSVVSECDFSFTLRGAL